MNVLVHNLLCLVLLWAVTLAAGPAFCEEGDGRVPVAKKEIPAITFKNLSPPYKDYVYFENHERYPFQPNASSFSLINAWWLAEASTLAYADEEFVRQQFSRAGLTGFRFFNQPSTQCFIANNRQLAIVVFRGSEIWKRGEGFDLRRIMADLMTDVDIRLSLWVRGGRVHRGFRDALEEIWDDLLPYMRRLDDQGCKIWLTGHSLGAALATLAAGRYQEVQGLYTFGSPRVGDREFQKNFRVRAYRVVNGEDIAAHLPPAGIYHHVGDLKFIDPNGALHDRLAAKEAASSPPRDASHASGSENEIREFHLSAMIPDSIRDHVPLLYAIWLWNSLVDSRF